MLYEPYRKRIAMETTGVEDARKRLPEILNRAHHDGTVTIVTKRGTPYAAIVPVGQVLRGARTLLDLEGSAQGCYADVSQYVKEIRKEWR